MNTAVTSSPFLFLCHFPTISSSTVASNVFILDSELGTSNSLEFSEKALCYRLKSHCVSLAESLPHC